MNNYYFLAPSLPPLILGEIPEITFEDLAHRLELNLSQEDRKKIDTLRLFIDLQNIKTLYAEKPIDPRGTLSEKELDEAFLVQADLPEYVFTFLNQFEEVKEKMRHHFGLISRYYTEEITKQKGFLKDLLTLQREMRLAMTAIRAKKMHRDIMEELQFEEFTDPFVAHILAQKDMSEYDPPLEYQDLKQKLDSCGEDPWEQFMIITRYQFDKIEEMSGYPLFTIDWIIGYVARHLLVGSWNHLDPVRGEEITLKMKTGT